MASTAATGSVELSIQMSGAHASGAAVPVVVAADGAGAPPAANEDNTAAADDGESSEPEKKLNCFVRVLATGELVGNALGTLASLWATFVLLGGYRSALNHLDFWIATAMVFLEAFRVFIRNFKLDNQSLFGSTKSFRWISSFARMLWRPQEGDAIVLIIGVVMSVFTPLVKFLAVLIGSIIQLVVLTVMSRTPLTEAMMRQLQRRRPKQLLALIFFPFAHAISTQVFRRPRLGLLPLLLDSLGTLTQVVAVLLLYFRPRRIGTLTSGPWGWYLLYVSKVISALVLVPLAATTVISPGLFSAVSTVVLLLGSLQDPTVPIRPYSQIIDLMMHVFFLSYGVFPLLVLDFGLNGVAISYYVLLAVLLIGNLQIPVTVAQIALSIWRLFASHGDSPNMVASIKVFYALVLCQGTLYIMASILAFFSVVPRSSLAERLGDKLGARAINLYYESAYTKRVEIGVFAEDTISLASFVVDSLNCASSSSELQLVGLRVLHSLLQQKGSNEELISVITRSEKAVPTLISMLGWTFKQDKDIRLFAAKVIADLSGYLRIAGIAGAVRLVSSLLDAETNQPPSQNDEGNGDDGSSLEQPQPADHDGDNEIGGSTRNDRGRNNCCPMCCSWVCLFYRYMIHELSIPDDPPFTSQDLLPVLGMMILERLACDPDNCAEIMKNTNLIPKIIGLISYTSNDEGINDDNALIISSSLKLVRRIATTNGKVGATLRRELWESPFLLSNLTCILEDSRSSPEEVRKPAIDIIAILALDEGARHELGSVQVTIHKLLHIFIVGQDGPTNYDQSLRVAAGGALANLAMESPENCLAILEDRDGYRYDLAKDLKDMLGSDEYRNVAASLLQNLCECSRTRVGLLTTSAACSRIKDWLSDLRVSNQLSSALQVVLQNIMAAEDNKKLEALIGLASQICYVLPPQPFVQGLESHNVVGAIIIQKLVNTLNSNKKPSHEYPRMRRVIVDMAVSVLRRYPGYAIIFRREGMIDALSKVETTPSKVEKYRAFFGNEGVVLERGLPLRELVATAKGLIHHVTPT